MPAAGRLGCKVMGLVVAVGIINMAETRPSRKWICPRKMLLVSEKNESFMYSFNFLIQQGLYFCTAKPTCAFLTPPHVSVISCCSIFNFLRHKIVKRHLEAYIELICCR